MALAAPHQGSLHARDPEETQSGVHLLGGGQRAGGGQEDHLTVSIRFAACLFERPLESLSDSVCSGLVTFQHLRNLVI